MEEDRTKPVFEFYEFEPRLKSAKNRFQLSVSFNLEKLKIVFYGTNHILQLSNYKFNKDLC